MEKMIKVNPLDIVYFSPYVRNNFIWGGEENCNLVKEVSNAMHVQGLYMTQLIPSSILVPQYRYSDNFLKEKLGIDIKYDDVIKLENLSSFTVQNVPDNVDYKIDIILEVDYSLGFGGLVRLWKLGIEIKLKNRKDEIPFYNGIIVQSEDTDKSSLEKELKTVIWADGKPYSKFRGKQNSLVVERIFNIEKSLLIVLNFLYTLYTNSFSKEDRGHILFTPFVGTLQSYGETFEDVLSTIKEAMIFVG
jgi:hypothetical protein